MTLTRLRSAAQELKAARQQLKTATQHARKQAIQAYEAGWPETVIADTLGVSRGTVRRWLGK